MQTGFPAAHVFHVISPVSPRVLPRSCCIYQFIYDHVSNFSVAKSSPIRYESDLSNEVLYALVGQEAKKISEVKVRGGKEIADSARFETDASGPG